MSKLGSDVDRGQTEAALKTEEPPKARRKPGSRPVRERVDAVMNQLSPEEEDARALQAALPDDLAEALMRATSPLSKDPEKQPKAPLLNMHARHQLIVKLRAQGMHRERIARAVGVSTATVDNVVKRFYERYADQIRQSDMDEFVLLLADGYLEDIDKLTEIVQSYKHPAAVVGAIKARQEARQKYVDILAEFGFLKRKALEVHVEHNGDAGGNTFQQNMIFLRPEDLKAASMEFLAAKRAQRGELPNADADERLSRLLVASDSPEHPAQE